MNRISKPAFLASLAVIALATPVMAAGPLDLQGHRGARGLAPENSLPAFAAALSLGVTTLELDTVVTRDGELAVMHDPALNPKIARTDKGDYLKDEGLAVIGLNMAELKRFDIGRIDPASQYARQFPEQKAMDGVRIPKLQEVFALVRKAGNAHVRFNIETKIDPEKPHLTPAPDDFARRLIDALKWDDMASRATIQSFDWRTLQAAQKMAPEIPTVYLSAEFPNFDTIRRALPGAGPWTAGFDVKSHGGSVPKMVKAAGGQTWSPHFRNVTAESLNEAKSSGLKVVVWTVNDEADMSKLIDLGVDGIISDYPDRLRRVMAAKGLDLPRATPVTP